MCTHNITPNWGVGKRTVANGAMADLVRFHRFFCMFRPRSAPVAMDETGGEGGIRTPDTVARMPHFECGAFNHSATSPKLKARGLSVVAQYLSAPAAGHKGAAAQRAQSSRPSLRSSEYGPPPRSAMA